MSATLKPADGQSRSAHLLKRRLQRYLMLFWFSGFIGSSLLGCAGTREEVERVGDVELVIETRGTMPILHTEAGVYVLDIRDQSKLPPQMRATPGAVAWPLKFRAKVRGHVSGKVEAFNSAKRKAEHAPILTVSELVILRWE